MGSFGMEIGLKDGLKSATANGTDEVNENTPGTWRTRAGVKKFMAVNRFAPVSTEPKIKKSEVKRRSRLERAKAVTAPALNGLKFISSTNGKAEWPGVKKRFNEITASSDGQLHRSQFGQCIGMVEKGNARGGKKSEEFALKLFDALSRRLQIKGDSITMEELIKFWEHISDQSFDSRLQTFFDMVDKDGDGRLNQEEVAEIITLSASTNNLSNIQKQASEYAALIMEELDPRNQGYIMIESLEMLLLQAEMGAEMQTVKEKGDKSEKENENILKRLYQGTRSFILSNWQRFWVLALWVGVMAGLFTYKYIQYRNRAVYQVMGGCVCLAKGAAETLKLNMALILLPVCRNTITWLRNKTKLGVVVPYDDNLNFHKVIAVAVAIAVCIHGVSHLACDFPRLLSATEEEYKPMVQYFGEQPTSYWHFVKSVEGVTGIIMVLLMVSVFTLAMTWFRRGKFKTSRGPLKKIAEITGFNAFWYSHHLFIIVYALLIVHGIYLYLTKEWYKKTTWMYLAVPMTLYACERLTRALRSTIKAVKITKVESHHGKVLALFMTKPPGFSYKSGQYMFVKCDAVSSLQWHPFSITSAPGEDGLSVHIREQGDWTRELRELFENVLPPPSSGDKGARSSYGTDNLNLPRVMIDGPYGAPAQEYMKYEVVLLVGLGIGATPMISIIKDIVNNAKVREAKDDIEKRNGAHSVTRKKKDKFKTKKAYFYWTTGEHGTFDWFKHIMNEVAEQDHNHVVELHNHCTSIYEKGDARSALITMLQSLNHAKNGVDVVSGTRVISHFARPSWRDVYDRIATENAGKRVGVFYCGSPNLVQELRLLALEFSRDTTTKFYFHKENF